MENEFYKKLSFGEFQSLSKEEQEGKMVLTIDQCYKTYISEVSKLIETVTYLSNEIEQLKSTKKKLPKAFDHTIDKRTRAKVVKMLKERYTVEETAQELKISQSSVNRIKKAEGLVGIKGKAKKKSLPNENINGKK